MNNGSLKSSTSGPSASSSSPPRWADPTRAFSILVLSIMSIRYLAANEWQLSLLWKGLYGHPMVIVSFILASIPYYLNRNNKLDKLSNSDATVVEWYWWNAWMYHATMDGLSGSFHQIPVVVHQYLILDNRFVTHHVGPWLIGVIELFVMAPLCIVTMQTILSSKSSSWRYPMEIITSTFQLFGMIVFVGAEVYEGQLNVPALDPVGIQGGSRWGNVKLFDSYHLIYYWFGFWFCNLVWGVVPIYRIVRACKECHNAFVLQATTNNNPMTNGASNGKKVH